MEAKKIYEVLVRKEFQDPSTGDLFFPVYIYTYDPSHEEDCRSGVAQILSLLKRPTNHHQNMHIQVWDYIREFFNEKSFGKFTYEELILKKESEGEDVTKWIRHQIFGADNNFFTWLNERIDNHYADGELDFKPYIFVNAFTEAYPYMRPGEFLKNSEMFTDKFKLILFYPGRVEGENFYLFNVLESENIYRANILNNLIAHAD